jgi:hypothetical protein
MLTWDLKEPADFRAACWNDITVRYHTNYFENVGIKQAEKISQKDSSLIRAVDEKGKE